jgi:hypothetical protein
MSRPPYRPAAWDTIKTGSLTAAYERAAAEEYDFSPPPSPSQQWEPSQWEPSSELIESTPLRIENRRLLPSASLTRSKQRISPSILSAFPKNTPIRRARAALEIRETPQKAYTYQAPISEVVELPPSPPVPEARTPAPARKSWDLPVVTYGRSPSPPAADKNITERAAPSALPTTTSSRTPSPPTTNRYTAEGVPKPIHRAVAALRTPSPPAANKYTEERAALPAQPAATSSRVPSLPAAGKSTVERTAPPVHSVVTSSRTPLPAAINEPVAEEEFSPPSPAVAYLPVPSPPGTETSIADRTTAPALFLSNTTPDGKTHHWIARRGTPASPEEQWQAIRDLSLFFKKKNSPDNQKAPLVEEHKPSEISSTPKRRMNTSDRLPHSPLVLEAYGMTPTPQRTATAPNKSAPSSPLADKMDSRNNATIKTESLPSSLIVHAPEDEQPRHSRRSSQSSRSSGSSRSSRNSTSSSSSMSSNKRDDIQRKMEAIRLLVSDIQKSMEDNTLEEFSADRTRIPKKTEVITDKDAAISQAEQDMATYSRMDQRLTTGLSGIREAKRGIGRLEKEIYDIPPHAPVSTQNNTTAVAQAHTSTSTCTHCAHSPKANTVLSDPSKISNAHVSISIPRFWDPLLWTPDANKWLGIRLSWLGFFLLTMVTWSSLEFLAKTFYHNQTGFPFALPSMLDDFTGEVASRTLFRLGSYVDSLVFGEPGGFMKWFDAEFPPPSHFACGGGTRPCTVDLKIITHPWLHPDGSFSLRW